MNTALERTNEIKANNAKISGAARLIVWLLRINDLTLTKITGAISFSVLMYLHSIKTVGRINLSPKYLVGYQTYIVS